MTRGPGVQDNWDNASVFTYNTTVSSSTGVTPHFAIFRREATPTCGEENNVSMDWRHVGRETMCLEEYERCTRQKSAAECPDVQTFNPEYPTRLFSVAFRSENHPWNQSQVEIILGGTLLCDEAGSSSLGRDKTSVISRRRKIGESRRVETILWRRCDSPES